MRVIDRNHWQREEHFQHFKTFSDPTFSLTTEFNISILMAKNPAERSLFLSYLHATLDAINQTPELRQRIKGEQILEFDKIDGNTTFINQQQCFGFCEFTFNKDFEVFHRDTASQLAIAKQKTRELLDVEKRQDVVFFSTIPWFNFSQFKHPFDAAHDHSIPKMMFGKIAQREQQYWLPLGITVHHGLVDGLHIAHFCQQLQHNLDHLSV